MGILHALVSMLVCCVMISEGRIAVKTPKNVLPTESRQIVKLLLRNFPLQESASYHNLVEDDDVGQPISKGNPMTQYAPAYPYQEESMSSNQVNAFKYQGPTTNLVKKTNLDLSRFEYALSTILLPPPIPSDLPSLSPSIPNEEYADEYYAPYRKESAKYFPKNYESNEDNAEVYYAPYMHNLYTSSESGNIKFIPTPSEEENADQYYSPYMQYEQPDIRNTAYKYYLPYNQYDQQQQDEWLQPFHHLSDDSSHESYGELPQHGVDVLYEGPTEENNAIGFETLQKL